MKLVRNLMMLMFTVLLGAHMTAHAAKTVSLFEPGPISISSSKELTIKDIRKAIISGAMRHQWQVESETPNTVRIKLDGRKDQAVLVMDIIYDTKSYSIKYVSSEGLRYDGSSIHSSYSRWMQNLTNAINTEFRAPGM